MSQEGTKNLIVIPIVLLIAFLVALAGSQGGYTVGIPVFILMVIIAFVIQWIVFIPSYQNTTEMYYDLTGSVTYLVVTVLAFVLTPKTDTTSIVLLIIISIWALRLGTFLYRRVHKVGEDRRFAEIKVSFTRFLTAWTLQGLWVSLTLAAALAAITSQVEKNLGLVGILGLLVWILGFGIEVVADMQKSSFNSDPDNKGKFINTGLWAWSRHPNYFGEIVLWIGVAIIAIPVLRGWQFVTLISPIFVALLITQVSGIPLLEERADEKWGGQEDYEDYKQNTPVLIPMPPTKKTQ